MLSDSVTSRLGKPGSRVDCVPCRWYYYRVQIKHRGEKKILVEAFSLQYHVKI